MRVKKDLISISQLQREEIEEIFSLASRLKTFLDGGELYKPLEGKIMALLFEKPSLRTRVTFEVAMHQLGGHAIYLGPTEVGLGVRESAKDCAKNLERWVHGIVARTFSHSTVVELASNCSIPIINGLSDRCHPCQVLSDCFTLKERFGTLEGLKVAFIGDGNNVAHSWIDSASILGFEFAIACPVGYEPDEEVVKKAKAFQKDSPITITHDIPEAVRGAQVLYTDVWCSMGQEAEMEKRKRAFASYQINSKVLKMAKNDAVVMHCLPAKRGEEITDEVLDGPQAIVYEQAENRLHVQKAILCIYLEALPYE